MHGVVLALVLLDLGACVVLGVLIACRSLFPLRHEVRDGVLVLRWGPWWRRIPLAEIVSVHRAHGPLDTWRQVRRALVTTRRWWPWALGSPRPDAVVIASTAWCGVVVAWSEDEFELEAAIVRHLDAFTRRSAAA